MSRFGCLQISSQDNMSFQTQIARQFFPNEQAFMARRKLRYLIWAVLTGIFASAALLLVMLFVERG